MANDIEGTCTEIDTSDSVREDYECRAIVEALENTIRSDSLWSAKWSIFRVPQVLRRHKPEAYRPYVVSIGPFHRRDEQFQPMEDVKQWYLHNLLSRLNISLTTLIQCIDEITEFEKRARERYAEPLDLDQHDFIKMMILDGCFLLELFWKHFNWSYKHVMQKDLVPVEVLNVDNDPIINMDCMLQYIFHDLLLLENQLPWSVLECLYHLTVGKHSSNSLDAIVLVSLMSQPSLACNVESYLHQSNDDEILHILDLVRSAATFGFEERESSTRSELKLHPATSLSMAGIEFRKSAYGGIMDMDFNFKDGIFTIPRLSIGESTEPLLRNLIAFEQCCQGRSHKVTSYAILMNSLIGTRKDMDFLCRKGIIRNSASEFFNKLHDDTTLNNFYFGALCEEVNKYKYYNESDVSWKRKWLRWLETLKRDYLYNPWKITSLVAAFILLALTLLQTAYTIQQYYYPPR